MTTNEDRRPYGASDTQMRAGGLPLAHIVRRWDLHRPYASKARCGARLALMLKDLEGWTLCQRCEASWQKLQRERSHKS